LGLMLYAALGLVFAVCFAVFGVARIDPAAVEGTWGFRCLVVPGAAAFWPWLAWRWIKGRSPSEECTAHRAAAGGDA
ncbi:MAG: hypothetical protein AAGA81_15845, partial [Acidobacteriota bacterium]